MIETGVELPSFAHALTNPPLRNVIEVTTEDIVVRLICKVQPRGFFFFQAEDGIRDYKVPGVQTCALPISSIINISSLAAFKVDPDYTAYNTSKAAVRSEERRVGKECRSRWWAYH